MSSQAKSPVYIVDGVRTPFLKAKGEPGAFSASDLAVNAGRALLARHPISADVINEVIMGCMIPSADEANIARIIALRLGCGKNVPAFTVQRNCASGMQALDNAMQDITTGRHDLVLAGGTEAMSRSPLLFKTTMIKWLALWMQAKSLTAKAHALLKLRPSYFGPVIALLRGLTDPLAGLNMGQTAENLAYRFQITRDEMDQFALFSHQRLAKAYTENVMDEIIPLFAHSGEVYEEDEGLRRDSSLERLAKLSPFFDKKFGMVTAGNSSQVTDGACILLLASKKAVTDYNLNVKGKIVACEWVGLDPTQMGLGPVYAINQLLKKQRLKKTDIDYWEINEAFAAQVIACQRAFADHTFCQDELGLTEVFGEIAADKLNVDGGAIAIGHPVGASGARITLHLLNVLRRKQAKRGIAAICIGGGQGGAMMIEAQDGV